MHFATTQTKVSVQTRRLPKAFVPVSLGVGLLVIALAVMVTQARRPAPASLMLHPDGIAATSWAITCMTDKYNKGGQEFSGSVATGGVIYLPANAGFRLKASPVGSQGQFSEENSKDSWDHLGGELNVPSEISGACVQEGRAPHQPGLYTLTWRDAGDTVPSRRISVVVLSQAEMRTQADRTSVKVNGKSIGSYAAPSASTLKRVKENAQNYQVPRYFLTLTPEILKMRFGEDFELGQLIAYKDSHNAEGKKVFTTERHTDVVPIRLDLIEKLVKLRDRVRQKGYKVTKFWVTSGFRTPDYNKAIKGATYSRHCYGDAVDIVIDEDNDKHMDDLNGDGRLDREDGLIIANACRELELEGVVTLGGIGLYEWSGDDSVRSHVHIDCRGHISRWGQNGAGKDKKTFQWWPRSEFQDEDGE